MHLKADPRSVSVLVIVSKFFDKNYAKAKKVVTK